MKESNQSKNKDCNLDEEYEVGMEFYCSECMGENECEDSCMCINCVETNGFKHLQVFGYD